MTLAYCQGRKYAACRPCSIGNGCLTTQRTSQEAIASHEYSALPRITNTRLATYPAVVCPDSLPGGIPATRGSEVMRGATRVQCYPPYLHILLLLSETRLCIIVSYRCYGSSFRNLRRAVAAITPSLQAAIQSDLVKENYNESNVHKREQGIRMAGCPRPRMP